MKQEYRVKMHIRKPDGTSEILETFWGDGASIIDYAIMIEDNLIEGYKVENRVIEGRNAS